MRVNVARVLPAVCWLVLVLLFFRPGDGIFGVRAGGDDPAPRIEVGGDHGNGGTTRTDRYLTGVAVKLARPGLYVDPVVLRSGRLTRADMNRIRTDVVSADGALRIAVLPASKLLTDDSRGAHSLVRTLAYGPAEVVRQLFSRVGVNGSFAVLVDARSPSAGRSFHALQFGRSGPRYDVTRAASQALECCAPSHAAVLDAFVAAADAPLSTDSATPPGSGDVEILDEAGHHLGRSLRWALGTLAALALGLLGIRALLRLLRRPERERAAVEVLRDPLDQEVAELSTRVSLLPPTLGDLRDDTTIRTLRVLDLVEWARQHLDVMTSVGDAEGVVSRLADARYELVALEASSKGLPVPEPTAPCFFDPRHGPSTGSRAFAPQAGPEGRFTACASCSAKIDSGGTPEVRRIIWDGVPGPYWDAGAAGEAYVTGYWQRLPFDLPRLESRRRSPLMSLAPHRTHGQRGLTLVWEPRHGEVRGAAWRRLRVRRAPDRP